MSLEDPKSDLNSVKNRIDDPNVEIQYEIMNVSKYFDTISKEFPEILVRKTINPAIHLGLMMICHIGRVSLENKVSIF